MQGQGTRGQALEPLALIPGPRPLTPDFEEDECTVIPIITMRT
jgi:hypothetical protein